MDLMTSLVNPRTEERGRKRVKPSFAQLLGITADALAMRPPDYIKAVLGPVRTCLSPYNPYDGLRASGEPVYVLQDEMPLNPDDFEPLTDTEWAKLEIFCFANCANEMRYRRRTVGGRVAPYIESFANEHDVVARPGMLAPDPAGEHIHIDGPFYIGRGAWGHLLNADYLIPIAECQQPGRKRGGKDFAWPFELANGDSYPGRRTPRLFSYINGGSPGD
jgi:hypothetical protein